jgi:hypothetical protein
MVCNSAVHIPLAFYEIEGKVRSYHQDKKNKKKNNQEQQTQMYPMDYSIIQTTTKVL